MHIMAYSMPDELTDHPVALRLAMLLYSSTDIADSVSGKCCRYAAVETFLCDTEKTTCFLIHFPDAECIAGVTTESVKTCATVHRNDVTLFKRDIVRYSMDDHIVDRRAQACRKRFCPSKAGRKALERGSCTMIAAKVSSCRVVTPGLTIFAISASVALTRRLALRSNSISSSVFR